MSHKPVLLKEVTELLDPELGEFIIDGTVNGGGHAEEILKRIGSRGKLLANDWDESQVGELKDRWQKKFPNVIFSNANYADIPEILQRNKLGKADGLLLDLGFSSNQLEGGRGFSFGRDEPLAMIYNENMKPLSEIIARIREEDLALVIREFGGERFAAAIARVIAKTRKQKPIKTTKELRDTIISAVPKNYERGRIDPATRTFQALRIYANGELDNLRSALNHLADILNLGGRVVIISFHSLEDRIVKQAFAEMKKNGKAKIITKKPVTATAEEMEENPRSRSAKLRAAELI